MLLIEPPLTQDEWCSLKSGFPEFQVVFEEYCRAYEVAVLSMPQDQLTKVMSHLVEQIEGDEVDEKAFHAIVLREVHEEEFEASGKVARLVVLAAMANTLEHHGCRFSERTNCLLQLCQMLIPACLRLAVDDHFGLLQVPA